MASRLVRANVVTVNDILEGHTVLDIECLDRLYLNGYVPNLQVGGQVVSFLTQHLGQPIPSPVVLDRIGQRFRRSVESFAEANHVPVIRFGKNDRKIDIIRPLLRRASRDGRSRVVAIGVAQELQQVFTASKKTSGTGAVWFSYTKTQRRTTCYYFYLWDSEFGPGFIKICAYFPYPIKIWLNGYEWVKRQASAEGIEFSELSNGFATCTDPQALQAICDRLGPGHIRVFAERWWARLPLPLTPADRTAGYWWELSMRQVETSRTLVFDAPRRARGFFEALAADNLDLGRPDNMEIIFDQQVRRNTPGVFKTAIGRSTSGLTMTAFYKHSRIKQYLKDGRALRIETVINDTYDLGIGRRLEHLDDLQAQARAINRRVLDTERVGQGCVLANPAFERVARPTLEGGRRAPALRFGDPRVMALTGALCVSLHAVTGLTNKTLRNDVARLLGAPYSPAQMSYDLRRLRLKGIIRRVEGTHTYALTPEGLRIAIFYTKVHNRLLTPLLASDQPAAPTQLREAIHTLDHYVADYAARARLPAA
jgi:hypothetical protein